MTVEIVLTHEDGCWHARAPGVDLAHADLGSLDALIEARLAEINAACGAVAFDFDSLPRWLRQYQPHYFNYTLRSLPGTAPTGPAADAPEQPAA